MKIIILGAGQVGGSLAEILIGENHDITLVDCDEERLQFYADRLDIRTIRGYCSYPGVLRQAGADGADMVIAVTNNDEANIVACQVAYTLFNVPSRMARIRSRHYFVRKDLFARDHIPIDVLVSPELIVTKQIKELIEVPGALRIMDVCQGVAKVVVLRPYYGSPLLGKTLAEIYKFLDPIKLSVIAIVRGDRVLDLSQTHKIAMSDRVYFITSAEQVRSVISAFRREEEPIETIMIAGGGNIGGNLARMLSDNKIVKIIDHNRARCERLANDLEEVIVLCGEANDSSLLRDEQIEKTDAFLALTNDDEANIISSIQAKHLGARQTFSLINRNDYFDVIEPGAINVRISPALATLGAILTHIRQGDIKMVFPVHQGKAEIIEAQIHGDHKTSLLAERELNQIKLPPTTSIHAIIRKGKLLFPTASMQLKSGDHVILYVADKRYIDKVEKLLEVSTGFF